MPDNYAVKLSLSEAWLMRVTLEEKLAEMKKELDFAANCGTTPAPADVEKYDALNKLAHKL